MLLQIRRTISNNRGSRLLCQRQLEPPGLSIPRPSAAYLPRDGAAANSAARRYEPGDCGGERRTRRSVIASGVTRIIVIPGGSVKMRGST